jgi:hypothetical protein
LLPGNGVTWKEDSVLGLGIMTTQPEFVEQLFEAALALAPGERRAFLDGACHHDLELMRTVESCWPRM